MSKSDPNQVDKFILKLGNQFLDHYQLPGERVNVEEYNNPRSLIARAINTTSKKQGKSVKMSGKDITENPEGALSSTSRECIVCEGDICSCAPVSLQEAIDRQSLHQEPSESHQSDKSVAASLHSEEEESVDDQNSDDYTSQLERLTQSTLKNLKDEDSKKEKDVTEFTTADVSDIRLYLNSSVYPYERWNLEFSKKLYAPAYYNYENFQSSYYGREMNEPMLDFAEYLQNPLFIIDCSRQPEAVKSSTVDVEIEFQTRKTKFPKDTIVYALIIHDAYFSYNMLNGSVANRSLY
ncbi:unnamed protein product [Ceutorhynchus assimilis]|uniref:Double jelly roll-like domain-containing protein n=1 Tax=Ceutorhynchus assimilis TaxID=467358 RepID=A0A9N9MUZ5_9CUCU|nr:unnamed protein product [Ceutorhynchus assimilis]